MLTPEVALERLFTSDAISNDWFTPEFLAQIPVSVQQVIDSLKGTMGAFQAVQAEGRSYLVVFERGSVPTQIVLNQQGQIAGLLFQAARLKLGSLNQAVEEFRSLPGQVSLLVREGTVDRASLNPNTPLAVGSTFKLAVLEALQRQIASGQHRWSEVVQLQPGWKSLPSGVLHTWPDGALLTLQTLAALMISQSDNTATDSLIDLVGRAAIEPLAPRNQPFLTTRNAFVLKSRKHAELLQRYRNANQAERQKLLAELDNATLPDVNELEITPTALDVEWFFTTEELCELMEQVQNLPLMSINSGVAKAQDWQRVAYKGGSEPGVLNLTTWLQAKNGKRYCVSATWNHDRPLDETRLIALYSGVLELLK